MTVRDALTLAHPHKRIEIIPFTTKGDRTTQSLHDIGGKALFTKELQDALLNGTIDGAVHSLKDVELHDLPLVLGAHLKREAAHDMLIARKDAAGKADDSSKQTLGTCSPRRRAQAQIALPHLHCVDLRGNVNTRLQRVEEGTVDATILAAAGLSRLNLNETTFESAYPLLQMQPLSIETFTPAAGQGVIVVECRLHDAPLFAPLNDPETAYCAELERCFSKQLGGSCRTALGAYVEISEEQTDEQTTTLNAKAEKMLTIRVFFEGRTQHKQLPLPAGFTFDDPDVKATHYQVIEAMVGGVVTPKL
jgi:hydroxymethylbilane synthase